MARVAALYLRGLCFGFRLGGYRSARCAPVRTALTTLGSWATALPDGWAPWGGVLAAARFHRPWGLCLSALPCVLILWRSLLRACWRVPQSAASLRGPPPRSSVVGGPPPLLLLPSLRSPPPRWSGARDIGVPPCGRGVFLGYRAGGFPAGWALRARVRRVAVGHPLGRAARNAQLPLVASACGRRSLRFARLAARRPLRSPCGRPRPPFSPKRYRTARRAMSWVSQRNQQACGIPAPDLRGTRFRWEPSLRHHPSRTENDWWPSGAHCRPRKPLLVYFLV